MSENDLQNQFWGVSHFSVSKKKKLKLFNHISCYVYTIYLEYGFSDTF